MCSFPVWCLGKDVEFGCIHSVPGNCLSSTLNFQDRIIRLVISEMICKKKHMKVILCVFKFLGHHNLENLNAISDSLNCISSKI